MNTREARTEHLVAGNLPRWQGASEVYSKAYRYMERHGADDALIKALAGGDEETIKAHMLRINTDALLERKEAK